MARASRPAVRSFPEVYATVASDLMTRLGDAVAAQAGPPTSEPVVPASDEDRVNAWNARRPEATDAAMLALAQQKYQEHLASGMPADVAQRATAEDLTHFRYGQRLQLYTYGQVGFQDQVAEAKRLAKLAARTTTPDPPPAPPTMPSAALTNVATVDPAPPAAPPQPLVPPGASLLPEMAPGALPTLPAPERPPTPAGPPSPPPPGRS